MLLLALCLKIFDGRRHTARVGEKVKLKEAGGGENEGSPLSDRVRVSRNAGD